MTLRGPEPELAVVVLSVGAPEELKWAIRSLREQDQSLEIVVVNSGGGDPLSRLADEESRPEVISVGRLLWPGGARNVGIRATRAPWIAFLAADHVARPGWATGRLALHHRGHRAVASAVVNSNPRNVVAWASHLGMLVRRLPGVPAGDAVPCGASYARSIFAEYGGFREDLRVGEDTEFNSRLRSEDQPVWAPAVQTVHRTPTSLQAMLRDQRERGRRRGLHWPPTRHASLPSARTAPIPFNRAPILAFGVRP
jgi:glycosyltransferase involved in cell wall biosynthesis